MQVNGVILKNLTQKVINKKNNNNNMNNVTNTLSCCGGYCWLCLLVCFCFASLQLHLKAENVHAQRMAFPPSKSFLMVLTVVCHKQCWWNVSNFYFGDISNLLVENRNSTSICFHISNKHTGQCEQLSWKSPSTFVSFQLSRFIFGT